MLQTYVRQASTRQADPPATGPMSAIDDAACNLHSQIGHVQDRLENLAKRLAPVMRPAAPTAVGDTKEAEQAPSSEHTDYLRSKSDRVRQMWIFLDDILARLEV